jgi:hypothetical protein
MPGGHTVRSPRQEVAPSGISASSGARAVGGHHTDVADVGEEAHGQWR